MSNYSRDLRSGSAILIDKRNDEVVATFVVDNYNSFDEMRTACNKKWDELDIADRKTKKQAA